MSRLLVLLSLFIFSGSLYSQDSTKTDLIFSYGRGIYDSPISLSIFYQPAAANVYFTNDGSDPSPTNGILYQSSILIDSTQPIRAVAYLDGDTISNVATHTYIFPEQVIEQPEIIEGYPKHLVWVGGDSTNQVWFDNQMDPAIVNDTVYKEKIIPSLKSIPALAIALDRTEFWEFYSGEVARKTSLEFIYPDKPAENEQIYCGIQPHGPNRLKRSMRVVFKKEFGKGELKSDFLKYATHNGEGATDHFDHLILRAGNNRSWANIMYESRTAYSRDQWFRDNQILMSGEGIRGQYFHLYVNGLYWGVYNITERADENFTADYFGGDPDNWYSFSHSTSAGNPERYNVLNNDLIKRDLSQDANYEEFLKYIDLENYSDYILSSWFIGVTDWPENNYWGGISNIPEGRLKFFAWDVEHSFQLGTENAWVSPMFRPGADWGNNIIPGIWQAARFNKEFMVYFSDRVYKHCFNGGLLTAGVAKSNMNSIHDFIRPAVITESARWGDALENLGYPTKTRDEHWMAEVNRLNGILDVNVTTFIQALRQYDFYPSLEPPVFNATITPNLIDLTITNVNGKGQIVYTINGQDPRNQGGSVNENASTSSGIAVDFSRAQGFSLKARILDGTEWSALHEAHFINKNRSDQLYLTEIMYHPPDSGTVDGKNFEYIELKNLHSSPIDISGVQITEGIRYTFPENTILEPGEIIVLVEDPAWFEGKYGFEPFGRFSGKLQNPGDYFIALDPDGTTLWSVDYMNSAPWPTGAVETNYSIVPTELKSSNNLSNPANWRLSFNYGGSPGEDDMHPVGVEESLFASDISGIMVYPNPVTSHANIQFQTIGGDISISLFNLAGQKVLDIFTGSLPEGSHTISFDKGHLSSGLYIMEINKDRLIHKQKLIIQ